MAVIASPTYNPASAYRPVQWQTMYTAFPPDEVVFCRFTVNVNGVDIATGRKSPTYSSVSITPPAVEYYFDIDIQQYLQRYLAPNRSRTSVFGDLNAETRVQNTDTFGEVLVTFEYEYRNGTTGKIALYPFSENSGYQYAGITTRQNGEDQSLDDFLGIPFVTGLKRFLSNAPISRNVCTDENFFLSFLGQWNFIQIRTFDSGGLLINTSYLATGAGGTANEMHTIGVGKPQLDAILAANYWSGIAPNWTNCAYYTISAGIGIPIFGGIIFVQNSVEYTFTFTDCCNRSLRMYWLNSLGGVDNYSFSFQELGINVTSELFQKPLNWPHDQADFGRARTNIKADKAYTCTKLLTNSDMQWIKELFYSVEVYIVNPDDSSEYWRVWLSDQQFTEKRHPGLIDVTFTVNLSQDIVTHRI